MTDSDLFDNNKVRYIFEMYPTSVVHLMRALIKILALNEFQPLKLDNDEFVIVLDLFSAIARTISTTRCSDKHENHPDLGWARIEIKEIDSKNE